MKRLLSRLGQGVLLLALVSFAGFVFADLAPGDFFSEQRLDDRLTPELADTLRARFGLDDPLPVRYGRWLASVVRGEGGYSLAHRRSVAELFWPRLQNTLLLTVTSTVIAWALALLLGTLGAYRAGGWLDRSTLLGVAALSVVPELLLALLGILVALHTALPLGGVASLDAEGLSAGARLVDRARHLVLPVTVLVLAAVPPLVRHVRASVLQALGEPFVRAARGHGIGGRRLLLAYVLPAAANPLITLFGLSVGSLLSTSLVVESVFSWPGLGPLLLESLMNRDLHVMLSGVLGACGFLVVGNLLADTLLLWVDPRSGED